MRKLGYIVLGLALLVGAFAFAGYRHLLLPAGAPTLSSPSDTRSITAPTPRSGLPSDQRAAKETVSGFKIFEMGINIANVLVGMLGVWMTMRGIRAEKQAQKISLRRDE